MNTLIRSCRSLMSINNKCVLINNVNKFSIEIPKIEKIQLKFTDKQFSAASQDTLNSLSDRFEEFAEHDSTIDEYDVILNEGVLTVHLGQKLGTYVLNKQSPNQQIWLSSPISGPNRFNFNGKSWNTDSYNLHSLLTVEISKLLSRECTFADCVYCDEINEK